MQNQLDRLNNKSKLWLVKVVASAFVLGFTLWWLPVRDVWQTLRNTQPGLWLFTLGVFVIAHCVGATKWWLLTGRHDGGPFTRALRAHFAGLTANLCLPGAAGGDVVRAGLVLRESRLKSRVAVGSVVDRVLDTLSLLVLSALGATFALRGQNWSDNPLVTVVLVCILGGVVVAFGFMLMKFSKKPLIVKLRDTILNFKNEPGNLALCFGLSLAVQSTFIGLNIALASGSGVHAPIAAWFFAWPLSKLFAMLPISMGGLGVREASLAALMTGFGAVPARVVAVGLLWQTILYASGLIGWFVLFMSAKLRLFPVENS